MPTPTREFRVRRLKPKKPQSSINAEKLREAEALICDTITALNTQQVTFSNAAACLEQEAKQMREKVESLDAHIENLQQALESLGLRRHGPPKPNDPDMRDLARSMGLKV